MELRSVAALIPVNARGEVLLMQRDEKPGLTFAGHWNLIGGGVEAGETIEQGLVRETREEIGVDLTEYRPYGCFRWREYEVSVFYTRIDQAAESLDRGEGQALRFFTSDAARKLVLVPITIDILAAFFESPEYQSLR